MPELRKQFNQPGTPPGLTGKAVKTDLYQAVSLWELRTAILGTTHTVTVNALSDRVAATAATTLETKCGNNLREQLIWRA